MHINLSTLFLLLMVRLIKTDHMIIFDNFGDGVYVFGSEEKMADYAILAEDKKMDLPTSFTICSSLHLNFVTSAIFFYQLYQDNGKPWFSLYIGNSRHDQSFRERLRFRYYKDLPDWNNTANPVPVQPNSWYHGCTALDTVTGHLLIVVNGHTIVNQVFEELINIVEETPKSLEGRLGLFKNYYNGFWYQSRQRLTNLNVYSSALTIDKMISITDGDDCAARGDYLSWRESQWNITGNIRQESVVKEEDLCLRSTSNIVLFTDFFYDWEECMLFCEKFPNTRAPSVASEKEFLDVMRAVEKIIHDPQTGNLNPGAVSYAYWIPITDSKIEGEWVDFYTSDSVNIMGVAAGDQNGGRVENCAIVVTVWGGWQDWECKASSASHLQCACESKDQMFLTMRGLCPDSNIDNYFVPQNNENDSQTLFRGLYNTIIEYHEADHMWHLMAFGVNPKTVATSDATKHSFLLGTSEWTVTDDNYKCNKGEPYTAVLKLSGCKDTEFTCHDGQCVKMEERCDQIMHCRDKSDEKHCSLLMVKEGYNRKVAPFIYDKARRELDPVKVQISTSIQHIIDISEVSNIIELKFEMLMEWYEHRVDYHNLKTVETLNTLSDEELRSLWIPYIIFQNTDNNEATEIDGVRSTVFIKRESEFQQSGIEIADEIQIFPGASNKLTIGQTYSKKFHCTYLLHYFPFDTQVPYFLDTLRGK